MKRLWAIPVTLFLVAIVIEVTRPKENAMRTQDRPGHQLVHVPGHRSLLGDLNVRCPLDLVIGRRGRATRPNSPSNP